MIKIGSFFEENIEKIVLVIVGLVCVWLLITRVIFSPNTVSYNDRNFSPSAIDNYIYDEAELLRQKLNEPPQEPNAYEPRVGEFLALLEDSIRDVDVSLWPVVPHESGAAAAVAGVYRLPRIGEVNDVAVEHIRAVAYVPIDEVTPQNPYDKAGNEPNDIDLVTVEAKFDVAELYAKFRESFVEDVEEQWADPCLAKPIFAAVQLQRQESDGDGIWSDWQDVPRTKIDENRKMFEIIEDAEDLPPGGLKVQMLRFDYQSVQMDLLQPQAYQIASAKEEWFPPLLHREFLDFQRKEELEERRQAKEAEREEREREQEERRSRRTDRSGVAGRGVGGGMFDTLGGAQGPYGGSDTRRRDRSRDRSNRTDSFSVSEGLGGRSGDRRRSSRDRTTTANEYLPGMYEDGMGRPGDGRRVLRRPSMNDVYDKYYEIMLTRATDFAKMREPLVFWAHDDTVEPEKTYRYRIRLGVFNPVAGTNQLSEQGRSQESEVILWSDFSDTTEPVEILGRLYFFANNVREVDKTVTVKVSRLTLGHWYSQDFPVKQGEIIGDVVESEPEKPERRTGGLGGRITAFTPPTDKAPVPETIDYGTGAVMVDAVVVNDWSGGTTLRTRRYYDMLYSFDGVNIKHMPVGAKYWDTDLQAVYSQIGRLEREPQEPFKDFGAGGRRRGRPGEMDYYEGMEMYDELMYEDPMMEGMGRRR
jgi:hypothetical protein